MVAAMIDEELAQLAQRYQLDESVTKDLAAKMKRRHCSFEEDIRSLRGRLDGAEDAVDIVRKAIHEMDKGTFGGQGAPTRRSRSRSAGHRSRRPPRTEARS